MDERHDDGGGPVVLVLCTGNAARSVMAGAMLRSTPARIVTAGTLVVEGQPMGRRTRQALAAVGFSSPEHRSHQLTAQDVAAADVVVAMASEHVAYIRRVHPEAAATTATIKRLVRDLPAGPLPLVDRVAKLGLADLSLEPWEDVEDPAGGGDEEYRACAQELAGLCVELGALLG
jgi:protein-tyrosine-phosphatase